APPAPSVDQMPDPWVTSDDRPSIQGGKDIDASYIQGYWSTDGVNWTAYCDVTTGVGATIWFCDPAFSSIPLGTVQLAAIAFSEANAASSMGAPITIERVPEPVVLSPANGSYTNNPTPVISGTATGSAFTLWYGGEGSLCSGDIVAGLFSCTPPYPLVDGTYEYTVDVTPGSWVSSGPWTFTVDTVDPSSPVITGPSVPLATTTSTHPTISGTGEPGATVEVYIDGVTRPCVGGAATVDQFGAWSCQIAPTQSLGTYEVAARQTDRAGNTSGGPLVTQLGLTVIAPPPAPTPTAMPSPTPAPTPSSTPSPTPSSTPLTLLPWNFDFGLEGDEFEPGDTTVVTGSGLPPGAGVDVEFHSTPVLLGSTVVKPDGTFSLLVTIPEDADAGEHHLVVLVTPVEGPPSVQDAAVTVSVPTEATDTVSEEAQTTVADTGGGDDRSEPAAPSALTGTIQTLTSVIASPAIIGTAALSGFVLLLFVAFPAELLNSTISEQYQRFARRVPKLTVLERFTNWLERLPWLGGLAITVVAAFIFGFADPGFGFDVTSLRVVLACAIALFIVGYLASSIAGFILRGRWNLATSMELKPLGLVLTIAGVLLSRLLDFSPGFLIGLLLGIGLVGRTSVGDRAKATLVQAGVVFALAILGWVGYSILMATGDATSFWSALALDTMVAITTEGLTALFIGLLPFRLLDGSAIFEHSKVVWAAAYVIAAAAFVLIVVPSAWGEFDGSLWLWIAVVGGFALVAVAVYLYFRFVAKPVDEVDEASSHPVTSSATAPPPKSVP
ncbi:MAG: Ig-like domain-containing protein, partial [Rhodoglobus sp.]